MRPEPGRERRPSSQRTMSWTVLALVAVAGGVGYISGDLPARSVALAALLAGSVLACMIAWRDNRTADRQRRAAELRLAMLHAEQLHAERTRQRAVVELLSRRIDRERLRAEAAELRSCSLQQQLSTARGNHEALRVELELQAVINASTPVVDVPHVADRLDPWVTARELWRISDDQAMRHPA